MQAGDLVFITACTSGATQPAISETGGQTWTALTQQVQTRNRAKSFWCIFNGTWDADPSVTLTSSANNTVRMLVFRPNGGTNSTWEVDVAESSGLYSSPSNPYTVTITGITTQTDGALVIAGWTSADDNTWGSLTGGWTVISPAQVRNTSGSFDQSVTHAWMVKVSAGGTGDVSQNQATLGGDAGTYIIMAFKEVAGAEQHSGSSAVSGNGSIAGAGVKGGKGTSTVSALGALATLGFAAFLGLSSISGGGSITAVGEKYVEQRSGSSAITGTGSITGAGAKGGQSASALSGNGNVTALGSKGGLSASGVSGGGSVAGVGSKAASGVTAVSGAGSLASAYEALIVLDFELIVTEPPKGGPSAITGGGAITAVGSKAGSVASSVSGDGIISAIGTKQGAGAPMISASGNIASAGTKQTTGISAISGGGAVTAEGTQAGEWYEGTAIISGGGTLSAAGGKTALGSAGISSDGEFDTLGMKAGSSSSTVSGGGDLACFGVKYIYIKSSVDPSLWASKQHKKRWSRSSSRRAGAKRTNFKTKFPE